MISCTTRHRPNRDPKFHQIERFIGAGRSTNEKFITFNRGWCFRIGLCIEFS